MKKLYAFAISLSILLLIKSLSNAALAYYTSQCSSLCTDIEIILFAAYTLVFDMLPIFCVIYLFIRSEINLGRRNSERKYIMERIPSTAPPVENKNSHKTEDHARRNQEELIISATE